MPRKYSILFGIIISTLLLLKIASHCPGWLHDDKDSIGNDGKNKATNNSENFIPAMDYFQDVTPLYRFCFILISPD